MTVTGIRVPTEFSPALVRVRAGEEPPAVSALAALVGNAGHDMEVLVARPQANQLQVHTLSCPSCSHSV